MSKLTLPDWGHVARELRSRYPDVRIVSVFRSDTYDGTPQQVVRFQAPLEVLKAHGLLTDGMLHEDGRRRPPWTALGDGYSLSTSGALDERSVQGCCDFETFTGTQPRERERFSVRDAQRVLQRIAKPTSA